MKNDVKRGAKNRTGTRERILATTLALFNRKGPERVTTAEIAKEAAINGGNLYYHFRTKEALVLALFAQFEEEALALVREARDAPAGEPATYSGFLRDWFALVWSHRFLFRDISGVIAIAPAVGAQVLAVTATLRPAIDGMLYRSRKAGVIAVQESELKPLSTNICIVSIYWPIYLSLQEGVRDLGARHLDWGLNQVASLLRPYLSHEAKADMQAMLSLPFSAESSRLTASS